MKYLIKTQSFLKNPKEISLNNLNFTLDKEIQSLDEKVITEINCNFNNLEVLTKEEKLEDIQSIVDKIEKYQKQKMSDKEVQKMINKISKYSELNSIKNSFEQNIPLSDDQLTELSNFCVKSLFIVSPKPQDIQINEILINNISVQVIHEEEFKSSVIIEEFMNNIFEESTQKELEILWDIQEEERFKSIKLKVQEIMGTGGKKKSSSRKEKLNKVDEYLKEKQKLIENNAESEFFVDIEFPLPQANDLERIIELGNDIFNRGDSKINLETLENDLDKRDVHYYTRALCYLKLARIDSSSRDLCLTYEGENFFKSSPDSRKDIIFGILGTDPLVKKIIEGTLDLNNEDHIKEFQERGINSDMTISRRISSLKSWINYLAS